MITESNRTVHSVHAAIHTEATDTIPNRNSASTYHRQEYTSAILHTSASRQTVHCTEFRNIYYNKIEGTKDM